MKNVHTITIKLEGSEWTSILDETFKKKNANVAIDGFRKGKAPKEVYIKKYGIESLYMEAVDAALPKAYTKVLEENELLPACEPKVDIKNIDENHVEFEFTVITRPEVKISSYKPFSFILPCPYKNITFLHLNSLIILPTSLCFPFPK